MGGEREVGVKGDKFQTETLPENHAYAVALHMMHYNFVKLHSKLRVPPAMAAGVTDRLCEVSYIVALWEAVEPKAGKRGPYKEEIEILFKEYDTLRTEIIARTSSGFQLVAIFSGLVGALIAWGASGHATAISICLLIFALAAVGVWFILAAFIPLSAVARRVAEIEIEVNRRAGSTLLNSESRRKISE